MTTIADVIAVARDLALDALERGESVAWVERPRVPTGDYYDRQPYGGRVHCATLVAREGMLAASWIVRYPSDHGSWYGGLLANPRHRFGTAEVRARILEAIAVVDPSTLPATAFPARSRGQRKARGTIEATTTVRPRLPEPPIPGVYTNIVPGHVTRVLR